METTENYLQKVAGILERTVKLEYPSSVQETTDFTVQSVTGAGGIRFLLYGTKGYIGKIYDGFMTGDRWAVLSWTGNFLARVNSPALGATILARHAQRYGR